MVSNVAPANNVTERSQVYFNFALPSREIRFCTEKLTSFVGVWTPEPDLREFWEYHKH